MKNPIMLNRKRRAMQLVFTTGLALLFLAPLVLSAKDTALALSAKDRALVLSAKDTALVLSAKDTALALSAKDRALRGAWQA